MKMPSAVKMKTRPISRIRIQFGMLAPLDSCSNQDSSCSGSSVTSVVSKSLLSAKSLKKNCDDLNDVNALKVCLLTSVERLT